MDSRFCVNQESSLAAIEDFQRSKAKGQAEDKVQAAVAELAREPLIIEYAKSFFPCITDCFNP
jgi:cell fate (sporulation/competence/biofilm development) regulator YmcA (YheA/YmcA/DUF963 family)